MFEGPILSWGNPSRSRAISRSQEYWTVFSMAGRNLAIARARSSDGTSERSGSRLMPAECASSV